LLRIIATRSSMCSMLPGPLASSARCSATNCAPRSRQKHPPITRACGRSTPPVFRTPGLFPLRRLAPIALPSIGLPTLHRYRILPASATSSRRSQRSLITSTGPHSWELRGRYPAIFDDPAHGDQARELFDDARALLDRIVRDQLFRARGVFAFWAANAEGDDVHLFADETRRSPFATFHFLRQQMQKPSGQHHHSLSDFIAPAGPDFLGGFAVGIHGGDELARHFEAEHDDYSAIMAKALADRLAEAFAEYLHQQARVVWGFGAGEHLSREELIREQYRGIRPAAGYPACPDHTEKGTLFTLLDAEARAGVRLTESYAMHPGAAVSGLYFSHPDSKYFAVGKINRDQVAEYATRKAVTTGFVEKWLAPNLGY